LINDANKLEMIWEMFAGVRSDRQPAKQLRFIAMNHAHDPVPSQPTDKSKQGGRLETVRPLLNKH